DRSVYDVKKVIEEIVDENSFFELHKEFAKNIVVGFARIRGQSIGLVCNQPKYMAGGLDIDSSDKAARFIRFCDAFNVPILTLDDVTGFFPGIKQELGGIVRPGGKILYAFSVANVPKITVILRRAFGGAYVTLYSQFIAEDLVYAWPDAEIAVMGSEVVANIIYNKENTERENREETKNKKSEEYLIRLANPYIAAGLGMIDDV